MEQQKWYVVIPAKIVLCNEISNTQKLLIGLIHSLSSKGHCYAHNKYLGNLLGVSQTSVSSLITDLISKGYLERVIHKSETGQVVKRELIIPPNLIRFFKAPSTEKSKEGLPKNRKYNSSSLINNFNNPTTKKIVI